MIRHKISAACWITHYFGAVLQVALNKRMIKQGAKNTGSIFAISYS
jgi:hypothetical protein